MTNPDSPAPASPAPTRQMEFAITLRGPAGDVDDVVDLLRDTLKKASHRYIDVQFAHLVEDMTHAR